MFMKKFYTKKLFKYIYVLFFMYSLSGVLHAQDIKGRVTFTKNNEALKSIFTEMSKQTNVKFMYNDELVNQYRVTVTFNYTPIENAIKQVLENVPLKYSIKDGVIVISPDHSKKIKTLQNEFFIDGRVMAKGAKETVPGATIIIKGTPRGAIAGMDGRFKIKVKPNEILDISYIGMKDISIVIREGMKNLVIEMETDAMIVEDVVVTGYGSVNRADMVGTTTTLVADEIMIVGKTNIADMLQGQVAGMIVTNNSSRAGSTPKIQIRGQSTLSSELGNQSPIWVVDGIIQDDPLGITGNMTGADDLKNLIGNQVSWLNPNDIETVTILKDASATAIYGSRASNGVIVITTKKPVGERISVNYSGSVTVNTQPKSSDFNYMNSQERILITEELFNSGLSYSIIPLKQMNTFDGLLRSYIERDITSEQYYNRRGELEMTNTDWFDVLTRTGVSQNHSISLSGRVSDKLSVRGSLGYTDNKGQELKNYTTQLTGRINLNAKINSRLTIDFTINGSKNSSDGAAIAGDSRGGGTTPLDYATKTSRSIPAFNNDGSPSYYDVRSSYIYNDNSVLGYNFINELNETSAKNIGGRLNMNFQAGLLLTDWLKYEFVASYAYNESAKEVFRSERSFSIANQYRGYDYNSVLPSSPEYGAALMPHGGELSHNRATGNSYNIQNKLIFSKTISDKHRINAMIVNEIRSSRVQSMGTAMWGYMPDRGNSFTAPPKEIISLGDNYTPKDYGVLQSLYTDGNIMSDKTDNFISLIATIAYSFDNRYVLNANVRNDMSNRFGQNTNNRFDPTYSFGFKWNITNETFMKDKAKWLTYLNTSVTYGIQGNVLLNESSDLVLKKNSVHPTYNEFYSTISSIPNPFLTWERTSNWDLSISGRIFDMFNFNINYYTRESNVNTSEEIGYENGESDMPINGGIVNNEGVEVSVSFNPVNTKDFGLNISLNASKNWNTGGESTLTENARQSILTYLSPNNSQIVKEGFPIGSMWSYAFSHLDDENGTPYFKHMNTNPELGELDPTSLLTYTGQADPFFTGGMSLNIRYKQLTLSSAFSLILGGKTRLPNPYTPFGDFNKIPDSEINLSKDLNKRWKRAGDEQSTFYPSIPPGGSNSHEIPGQKNQRAINMWAMSDAMVVNAGFFRCNNISLGYNINASILKKIGISMLSISGSVSNPFVIGSKRFNGFDPELKDSVMPKTYSVSINIGF